MTAIQQAYVVDGKFFATKEEAQNYIRRPKIEAALQAFIKDNAELVGWLIDNQETVEMAFETGTIRRVSKVEAGKLAKALEYITEKFTDASGKVDPKVSFVVENASAIKDSFRWPSVKRMSDEEKATAARNTLAAAVDGNEKLAEWIIANKDQVLDAYKAGVEKRVAPNNGDALVIYRASVAAKKFIQEQGFEPNDLTSEQRDATVDFLLTSVKNLTVEVANAAIEKYLSSLTTNTESAE